MWRFRAHARNVFFPLYEDWESPKRRTPHPQKAGGGGGGSRTPPPPGSAPGYTSISLGCAVSHRACSGMASGSASGAPRAPPSSCYITAPPDTCGPQAGSQAGTCWQTCRLIWPCRAGMRDPGCRCYDG